MSFIKSISVALLEGNLSSVDALKDIKDELKKRKDVSFVIVISPFSSRHPSLISYAWC